MNCMTGKKHRIAGLLVRLNALKLLVLGVSPGNDALEIDAGAVLADLRGHLESQTSICAQVIADFYMDMPGAVVAARRARHACPELYDELEGRFMADEHIQNFLSVIADACADDGEWTVFRRLKSANGYRPYGPGKDFARRRICIL